MTINDLPISKPLLNSFIIHLEKMGVQKMYSSMLSNLNKDPNLIFLTAYCKQDYLNRDRLLELYNILRLKGNNYLQILGQIKDFKKYQTLSELKDEYPELGVDVLEMLYFKPEEMSYLITQQVTELITYDSQAQQTVTEETIRVYMELQAKCKLFTCNFTKLFNDKKSTFNPSLSDALNIEIAKRVVYLQKTLHQLRGTRICIIDTETTGLVSPLPIQISFLLFDMNFNLIKSYSRYILQEYIETSATTCVHGITVQKLKNELPSVEPHEAYEEIKSLLNDPKVIFIAHNASYDVRVLNNFSIQCTDSPIEELNEICTFRDYNKFSDVKIEAGNLPTVLQANNINTDEVLVESKKLFANDNSRWGFHDARFDVTALYMFIKQSKFFTNI